MNIEQCTYVDPTWDQHVGLDSVIPMSIGPTSANNVGPIYNAGAMNSLGQRCLGISGGCLHPFF